MTNRTPELVFGVTPDPIEEALAKGRYGLAQLNPNGSTAKDLQAEVDALNADLTAQGTDPTAVTRKYGLPKPLPSSDQDPDVKSAVAARASYERELVTIRQDSTLSPLERARRVTAAWETLVNIINAAAVSLHERRVEYLQQIQAKLKVGPEIPEGTSAADRAVLMQAFRAALDRVRSLSPEQMASELQEAARFGDDLTNRAIEVVAIEEGRSLVQEQVFALRPDLAEANALLQDAIAAVEYRRVEDGYVSKALSTNPPWLQRPPEVDQLPQLEEDENKRLAYIANGYPGSLWIQ